MRITKVVCDKCGKELEEKRNTFDTLDKNKNPIECLLSYLLGKYELCLCYDCVCQVEQFIKEK